MSSIPGNKPVAFRMPCCDSMNSPSPRFYSEIFNRTSPKGNFLGIDSSVMVILTTNDTSLPRELVMDADGRERFRKYLPSETNATTRVSMGSFTTTIEDYPYPYVIGKLCWEFPCIVPSDWEANNLHEPNNPKTVEDWKRALDAIVHQARRDDVHLSSARLDSGDANGGVHRLRGDEVRQASEVFEFQGGAGAVEQESASREIIA